MAITLEEAQRLELTAPLRLKFANIDDRGYLRGDSGADYQPFFQSLPGEWKQTELGMVETRSAHRQPA